MRYQIKQTGLTLDQVCLEHYGGTGAYTELVLSANTGLAAMGEYLPIGTVIELPEVKQQATQPYVHLWS